MNPLALAIRHRLQIAPLIALLAAPSLGQNSTCASPAPLSGTGQFAFDNGGVGTSGFNGNGACSPTGNLIERDLFYQWTATADGTFRIHTEGSSFNTRLRISAGTGCQAQCMGYNDEGLVFNSSELFLNAIISGETFLIQVGADTGSGGPGMLSIETFAPCPGIPEDPFEENDTCDAPAPLGEGNHPGLRITRADVDYFVLQIPARTEVQIIETSDTAGVEYRLFDPNCGDLVYGPDAQFVFLQNTDFTPRTIILKANTGQHIPIPCGEYGLNVVFTADPCQGILDDVLEDNDTCANARAILPGNYTQLHCKDIDPDYYSITLAPFETLQCMETSAFSRVSYRIWDRACNVLLAADHDSLVSYTNTSNSPQFIKLQAFMVPNFGTCDNYSMEITRFTTLCGASQDDPLEDNDDCASAAPISDGNLTGLFVSKTDGDFYSFCVGAGTIALIDLQHDPFAGDIDLFLFDVSLGTCISQNLLQSSETKDSRESILYPNNTGQDLDLVLEVRMDPFSPANCNRYDLLSLGLGNACGTSPPVGVTFCDPMDPNSSGLSTTLSGSNGAQSGSELHLEVTSGPPGQFGYLLVGSGSLDPGMPLSNGRLCLDLGGGNSLGRYNRFGGSSNSLGLFDSNGVWQNQAQTSEVGSGFDVPQDLPLSGNQSIQSGSTWYFQMWHREAGGQSNLSNGLGVTF